MRLTRTADGRLAFVVTDDADYDLARRVVAAMREALRLGRGTALSNFDGEYVDLLAADVKVTVHLHRQAGLSVFAADEAAEGVLLDVANYLKANANDLGIGGN